MIPEPTKIDPALQKAVDEGRKVTFFFSPNTKVSITSTNASEVQQLLEACEPVEDAEDAGIYRHNCMMPLLNAYAMEPVETKKWMQDIIELMEGYEL